MIRGQRVDVGEQRTENSWQMTENIRNKMESAFSILTTDY
jgi:hypothetical protein